MKRWFVPKHKHNLSAVLITVNCKTQLDELQPQTIKKVLDFLRPIRSAEAFEAVDWLADIH